MGRPLKEDTPRYTGHGNFSLQMNIAVKPGIAPGLYCIETGPTRLELATSGVTGRRSNQLNYDPVDNGP